MTTTNQYMNMNNSLGAMLSEYGATKVRSKGNLWSGIVFIIIGLIAIAAGIVAAVTETGSSVVGFCGGVGLLSAAGGAWAVWTHRQEKGMAVRVHQDGLVWQKNGRTTAMRWDDVLELGVIAFYNRQLRTTFYTYTLKDRSDQKMRLNLTPGNLDNAQELAQTIQQEVTRRQLGRAITTFNAGQPVQFGPLTIAQEGIGYGRKSLPWSQFAGASLSQRGHFVVRAKEQKTTWARIEMVKMPNMFTFVALANQISGLG